MSAQAQTPWPDYMPSLEPDRSESPLIAELPPPSPDGDPPAAPAPATTHRQPWLGEWTGWAGAGRTLDLRIAIESLNGESAKLAYAEARTPQHRYSERVTARWVDDELHALLNGRVTLVARLRGHDVMEVQGRAGERMLFAGVLVPAGKAPSTRETVRIATPFTKLNKPVLLEMVVFKPPGPGPFPAVLFTHGSTGKGDVPAMFKETWTSTLVARFFNERGWLVAFPQRRGRGKSDGLYDEGFNTDRSAYTCDVEVSLAGFDRALADVEAAAEALSARSDVNAKQMLIAGVSRGGILSIAAAGMHPERYVGAINFVGGWMGEGCKTAATINGTGFQRGAAFGKPTLWLYGERDHFYTLGHSLANFKAFQEAGGRGEFRSFDLGEGRNGHFLHAMPAVWQHAMDAYLRQIASPR